MGSDCSLHEVEVCPVQPGCDQTFTGQPRVVKNSRKCGCTLEGECCGARRVNIAERDGVR